MENRGEKEAGVPEVGLMVWNEMKVEAPGHTLDGNEAAEALEEGMKPLLLVEEGMEPLMEVEVVVGDETENGEVVMVGDG